MKWLVVTIMMGSPLQTPDAGFKTRAACEKYFDTHARIDVYNFPSACMKRTEMERKLKKREPVVTFHDGTVIIEDENE